ncbi:MAG: hypothetical protein LQ342_005138 [Letrouitia transgressa]|nr:MAG: hypothetical protein LQ342_005138 [Letrouitia transgressa]
MENTLRYQTVNIRFTSAGARPPIYIAGSFTSPEWVPQEMDYHLDAESREFEPSYIFFKSFDLLPGRYFYKLRLGDGDWWVCDDRMEIGRFHAKSTLRLYRTMQQQLMAPPVEDSSGNLNNLLVVKELHRDPDPDPDPDLDQAGAEAEHNPSDSEKSAIPEEVAQDRSIIEGGEGHGLVKEPFSPSRSERTSESTIQVQDVHQSSLPEESHGGARRRLVGDHSSSVTQVTASNSSASSSPPLETFWEKLLHWLRSIWLAFCGGTRERNSESPEYA